MVACSILRGGTQGGFYAHAFARVGRCMAAFNMRIVLTEKVGSGTSRSVVGTLMAARLGCSVLQFETYVDRFRLEDAGRVPGLMVLIGCCCEC